MKRIIERRKYPRFAVEGGALAVLRPHPIKLGRIMDISCGGVDIRYFDQDTCANDFSELSILMSSENLHLNNLPVKTVSDCEVGDEFLNVIEKRKKGMQFGALTENQRAELEAFIHKFTSGVRPDRRHPNSPAAP